MNQSIRIGLLGCALAGSLVATTAVAQERFATIGTGGQTGVYYTAGQSVCRLLNRAEVQPAIKCNAPSTAGSVTNIVSLHNGEYELGFIGVPGSGSRETFDEVMKAKGWSNADFALAGELKPAEMASALGDNNLDAITYVVGHPSGAIQEALTNVEARLIPVSGAEIEKLLQSASYYTAAEIPAGLYPGVDSAVPSIGGKAVLAATTKTDPEIVYQLVKAVFDNLERFKRLHPAFADLEAKDMIRVGLTAPLHEGAERFYKEKGWL